MTKKIILQFLEQKSMHYQAKQLAKLVSGKGIQWQKPYGFSQHQELCQKASVWIDLYPAAILTRDNETILEVLSDPELWDAFQKIGIKVLHTNPLGEAGGIDYNGNKTPSVDGRFDKYSYNIDPEVGGDEQYKKLIATAQKYGGYIAGDVIPAHTGKNADFRLAELNYKDYPGLYVMVEITPEDWDLLPEVINGDSANLSQKTAAILEEKGYIVGRLPEVIFGAPGIKESNWSTTGIITGVDGIGRRWVYLHHFKSGQPTLNWSDPTFAAQRLIFADIINSRLNLGLKILRLDANPHLAIEIVPNAPYGISRGHSLALNATIQMAMFMRKLGGWTYEENIASFDNLKKALQNGTELTYDFATRAGYAHAVITGNSGLLNLELELMQKYAIDPGRFIHALQNHDCLNYDLPHLWEHATGEFLYNGTPIKGKDLDQKIWDELTQTTKKLNLLCTRGYSGIATTYASMIAARLGISKKDCFTETNKEKIQQALMPIIIYNAMQPGVFQLSGWDLLGALNLEPEEVKDLMADGDIRWVERGAYDFLGKRNNIEISREGMPKMPLLFGNLKQQQADPNSFVAKLTHVLKLREKYKIPEAKRLAILPHKHLGTVLMLHQLPKGLLQITAINFGDDDAIETIDFTTQHNFADQNKKFIDILSDEIISTKQDSLIISLKSLSAKVYVSI